MMPLAQVNALPPQDFMTVFGDVAEHSSWVAERAMQSRPFTTREAMVVAFSAAVEEAAPEARLALVRAHPDLAARARLTEDSAREQAGVGLDALTREEFSRFNDLNARYKSRFGFPFIFAVMGAAKQQILASFEARIGNRPEAELAAALAQVYRIVRFRIEDRVAP